MLPTTALTPKPPITSPPPVTVTGAGPAGIFLMNGKGEMELLYALPDPGGLLQCHGGFIELTLPDKPNSRLQQYRLTPKGEGLLKSLPRD